MCVKSWRHDFQTTLFTFKYAYGFLICDTFCALNHIFHRKTEMDPILYINTMTNLSYSLVPIFLPKLKFLYEKAKHQISIMQCRILN